MGDEVLWIRLLGTFSVALNGDVVGDDAWRLRKAKTLVKLLALAPERRLHADRAAESLWPDRDPVSTRNNLHQAIYASRRALDSIGAEGKLLLELNDDLIVLCPQDPVRIDVLEFERAAADAREEGEAAGYRAALDAYDGELLPEDRYEEWTAARRDSLRELRLALGVELAELEASDDQAAAIGRLRAVLVDAPLHEPAHRALMRLYVSGGRRQEALAQFQELKRGLRREFEDEPDEKTRRLYREILTRSTEPEATPQSSSEPKPAATEDDAGLELEPEPPSRLPRQLTSFIGRQRELGEIAALLRGSRLLTLTGAGGSGKTRLAFELAAQRAGDFPDGVWPVELAGLGEPEMLGLAIAQALDTRLAADRAPEVALASHIGDRRQLLLLDNCEHLVEPVAHLVEALLSSCPNLTVLATSREKLRVPGEVTWRVPSMSLPRMADLSLPAQALEAESVRLFAARAAQAAPDFEVDDGNAIAVATLCYRLDGMPLAIELAAARVSMLTPAQIVERLDDSLDLLSAGSRTAMTRQQTLRATLAWSFDLLDADEQILLRRLSVFAGSFGVEAAEGVCAEDPARRGEVVDRFGRLIDKCLVYVEEDLGERRYALLETVRQFAAEQLEEAGERSLFERRHREWYLELAESDPTPAGDLPPREWLRRLSLERDNLRAALASAQADDPQLGLRLAVAVWRFWLMRGYLAEAYRWLTGMLEAAPERTTVRACALLAACMVPVRRGVYERIREFAAESMAISLELDDHAGMFDAIEIAAAHRVIVGDSEALEALLGEYGALLVADLPAARPPVWAAHTRGVDAWLRREYPEARRCLEMALERVGELAAEPEPVLWPLGYGVISAEPEFDYPFLLQEDTVLLARHLTGAAAAAYMLVNLAAVDRAEGDLARAGQLTEESLARFRHLEDRHGEAYALNVLGNIARCGGDFERGRELFSQSLVLRQRIGDRRGSGMTLACLAMLLARSGDTAAGRASAEQSRRWFIENDDLVGLGAAEVSLACVALCVEDRAAARRHLEAAVTVLEGLESSHHVGWALAAIVALSADDDEPEAARLWLDRTSGYFALLRADAGLDYCRELEAKALQSRR